MAALGQAVLRLAPRYRLRLRLLLPAAVPLLLVSREAQAQVAFDWQISGSATVGFTDNVVNTPEPENEGDPEPEADGFGTVSPGISLQFETPSATQTLAYNFGYSFYFIHTDANSFSNSLNYGLRAPTSDTTSFTLVLSGAQSTVQQLTLLGPAGGATAQPTPGTQPDGTDMLISAGLGQGFNAQLSETVNFSQALQGNVGRTIVADGEDTGTYVGSLGFTVSKAFAINSLSFEQGNDLQYTPEGAGVLATAELAQVLHRLRMVWSHQFSDTWTSQLGAGVVLGYDAINFDAPIVQPTGLASIAWAGTAGTFGISASHDAQPNLLLRQVVSNDALNIQGRVQLPRGFDVAGSTGAQITQSIIGEDSTATPGMSVVADIAFGWVPANSPVRIDARYQFSRQFALGEETTGVLFPTIQRHTVLLGTTFAYPGTPEAGGAAPFVALPPVSANPDILANQAPKSERAKDEEEKLLKEELRGKKDGAEGE
jgi:hypothetical protein